jgi:hypothetical protein
MIKETQSGSNNRALSSRDHTLERILTEEEEEEEVERNSSVIGPPDTAVSVLQYRPSRSPAWPGPVVDRTRSMAEWQVPATAPAFLVLQRILQTKR